MGLRRLCPHHKELTSQHFEDRAATLDCLGRTGGHNPEPGGRSRIGASEDGRTDKKLAAFLMPTGQPR